MYIGVYLSKHLKEELVWATDKWLQVNSNIMLFKTLVPLTNKAVLSLTNIICIATYVVLSNVF